VTDNDIILSGVSLRLVDTVEAANDLMAWLSLRRPDAAIGLDIETGQLAGRPANDALSPWHGQIRLVQIGDAMSGWAIPWPEWSGLFYEAMNRFTGPIVIHNIAFEDKWFQLHSEWKIPWHRVHDTLIMGQILYPQRKSIALKDLAREFVDKSADYMESKLTDVFKSNGWNWGTIPIQHEVYWGYGALDPVITMRLWEQFYPRVAPGTQFHTAYELEMAVRRIANKMEMSGARIDPEYAQLQLDKLGLHASTIKHQISSDYNTLISSPAQLSKTFVSLGANLVGTTPDGKISVDKEQLDILTRDSNPRVSHLAQQVLEFRKSEKLASSYFQNFLSKNIDGILHPSIKTLGARTSRMSITDPALQTLPSDGNIVRKSFIPREPGNRIITSDLDQVEFRMFASYCQDPGLIEMFRLADETGSDAFTQIGRQVYQDPTMKKSDPRRSLIKGVIYGRLYGAGVAKQASTAGVAVEQMQAVSDSLDQNYPGMASFQKKVTKLGEERIRETGEGYIETWTKRQVTCDGNRPYTLVNYLIQGGAAEVFKNNLVKLDNNNLTDYLIVPVHDEIVLEAPESEAYDVMHTVQECMTTTEGWAVPLTAGVDGPFKNWGEKYEK
jgi:DNA polymerase-1